MHTPTVAKALDNYAKAVERRTYWQSNGHRGDGMLESAQHDEKIARAGVFQAIRNQK